MNFGTPACPSCEVNKQPRRRIVYKETYHGLGLALGRAVLGWWKSPWFRDAIIKRAQKFSFLYRYDLANLFHGSLDHSLDREKRNQTFLSWKMSSQRDPFFGHGTDLDQSQICHFYTTYYTGCRIKFSTTLSRIYKPAKCRFMSRKLRSWIVLSHSKIQRQPAHYRYFRIK